MIACDAVLHIFLCTLQPGSVSSFYDVVAVLSGGKELVLRRKKAFCLYFDPGGFELLVCFNINLFDSVGDS